MAQWAVLLAAVSLWLIGELHGGRVSLVELTEPVADLCRGQIRFYRKSAKSCTVKLTISYEVPGPLAPFAGVSLKVLSGVTPQLQ